MSERKGNTIWSLHVVMEGLKQLSQHMQHCSHSRKNWQHERLTAKTRDTHSTKCCRLLVVGVLLHTYITNKNNHNRRITTAEKVTTKPAPIKATSHLQLHLQKQLDLFLFDIIWECQMRTMLSKQQMLWWCYGTASGVTLRDG